MRARKYPVPEKVGNDNANGTEKEIESYIGVDEAAEFLCRSKTAIYNLYSKGKIPGYKKAGRLHFKKSELDWWVKSSNKGGFHYEH